MANVSGLEIKISPEEVQEAIELLSNQMRIYDYSYSTVGTKIRQLSGSGCTISTMNTISEIYDTMLDEICGLYRDTIQLLRETKSLYETADETARGSMES